MGSDLIHTFNSDSRFPNGETQLDVWIFRTIAAILYWRLLTLLSVTSVTFVRAKAGQ